MLLTVAFALGVWSVLAAWSGVAHAETLPASEPCAALPVEGPPPADPVAFSEPTVAEPTAGDPIAFADPVVVDPALADPLSTPAVAPAVDPTTTDVPPAPPTCEPAATPLVLPPPPAPVVQPAEVSPEVAPAVTDAVISEQAPTSLPFDGGAAVAEPVRAAAEIPPTATLVDLLAVMASTPPVDAALVDPEAVDLAEPAREDAAPACSKPETGAVDATALRATPLDVAGIDTPCPALGGSATTTTVSAAASAPVSVPAVVAVPSEDVPPAAPTLPPAPVRLPAPLPPPAPLAPTGPAGPAGSSAAGSSGAFCSGTGSGDHSDGIDAVLDAQVAVSLAQAALRPSSGFAGSVVGGADDPGASPG